MKILRLPQFWCIFSIILTQHLSLADDDHEALEKYDDTEEEFGIEANEEEEKEFKTKAHFDPGTFYYVLSKNPQKNVQFAAPVAPILSHLKRGSPHFPHLLAAGRRNNQVRPLTHFHLCLLFRKHID